MQKFENLESYQKNEFDITKIIIAILLLIFFAWCNFLEFSDKRNLLHIITFPIHEVGHILFIPLGRFMTIAGGSLFQIIVPLFCIITFFSRGEKFSAAVVTMWLGYSFFSISIYARDAVYMELPLANFFGPAEGNEGHDWHNMLSDTNMLAHSDLVANIFVVIAAIITITGIFGMFYYARKTNITNSYEHNI